MSTAAPTDVRVRTWLIGISTDECADLLSASALGRVAVIVNGRPPDLPFEPRPSHGALLQREGRASYATYFIHPLVLTVVMILFASVLLAPVIKFVLVAAVAIPACFAAGYALTRLPGFSKVL